jgi:DNA processing protein
MSACVGCARRARLLADLSGVLECCVRDRKRLLEVLTLEDDRLLAALAGSRIRELRESYERFDPREHPRAVGVETICRHSGCYPPMLDGPAAPRLLDVAGSVERLAELTSAPMVAILGANAPSDYGVEVARSLARGLAAAGVSVVACLRDGVGAAAHAGVLDAGGGSVAVLAGGLDVACPARRQALYSRIKASGCAVSELPLGCRGRSWGALASERIVVELASVTVVVEARDDAKDLAGARVAQARGRTLAAIPGRVSSPLSSGPLALLLDGASLVRGPQDVLDLLSMLRPSHPTDPTDHDRLDGPDGPDGSDCASALATRAVGGANGLVTMATPAELAHPEGHRLDPGLRATLELVRAGADTPEKLAGRHEDPWGLLSELSELELLGLLVRGDGGRYVPSAPR